MSAAVPVPLSLKLLEPEQARALADLVLQLRKYEELDELYEALKAKVGEEGVQKLLADLVYRTPPEEYESASAHVKHMLEDPHTDIREHSVKPFIRRLVEQVKLAEPEQALALAKLSLPILSAEEVEPLRKAISAPLAMLAPLASLRIPHEQERLAIPKAISTRSIAWFDWDGTDSLNIAPRSPGAQPWSVFRTDKPTKFEIVWSGRGLGALLARFLIDYGFFKRWTWWFYAFRPSEFTGAMNRTFYLLPGRSFDQLWDLAPVGSSGVASIAVRRVA